MKQKAKGGSGTAARFIGLALLLLVAVSVVVVRQTGIGRGAPAPIAVQGTIGSEKAMLLDDEEIRKILKDKYGLTVDYKRSGSLELVQGTAAGQDFLWPAGQYSRELYDRNGGRTLKAETTFNSPIVMYAWGPVTQALQQNGVAEQVDGTYYVDLPKLVGAIEAGRTWRDVGLPQLNGRLLVQSTDPAKSNSGNLFAALLANTLNGGEVVDDATVGNVTPQLRAFYRRLGYLNESSGFLFEQFLTTGMGSYPIIVGYENQLIEYSLAYPQYRDRLLKEVNILYPRPTVWASHTLLALTPGGVRLLEALQDPEIQRRAWERHGFRSGLIGVQNDPGVLQIAGIPRTTIQSAMPIPRASAMDRILQALQSP